MRPGLSDRTSALGLDHQTPARRRGSGSRTRPRHSLVADAIAQVCAASRMEAIVSRRFGSPGDHADEPTALTNDDGGCGGSLYDGPASARRLASASNSRAVVTPGVGLLLRVDKPDGCRTDGVAVNADRHADLEPLVASSFGPIAVISAEVIVARITAVHASSPRAEDRPVIAERIGGA